MDVVGASVADEDASVLAAPRRGDEQALGRLVDRYHASMVRVARACVATNEAAADVVQDASIGVIQGLDRFEGRSSLETWMFRIVINKATTKGGRDARSVPNQRLVITLRDVEGFTAEEACELPGVSEANQRVLLHRARSRVRAALEGYVNERAGIEP